MNIITMAEVKNSTKSGFMKFVNQAKSILPMLTEAVGERENVFRALDGKLSTLLAIVHHEVWTTSKKFKDIDKSTQYFNLALIENQQLTGDTATVLKSFYERLLECYSVSPNEFCKSVQLISEEEIPLRKYLKEKGLWII